jgi:extracellular factor (EF) 3-hydroxypalmitic acid methyl ester biosynthesis protein
MMTNEIHELRVRITGPDSQNIEAQLERLTWHSAVVRIFDANASVRVSQVFSELVIEANGVAIYADKAVVVSVIDSGASSVCALKLSEAGFRSLNPSLETTALGVSPDFQVFLKDWQKYYRILPEFKIVVTDMQMFLQDLQRWLDRLELTGKKFPPVGQPADESLLQLSEEITQAFTALHERFEEVGAKVPPELKAAHAHFTQRQLHPLVLCSPFAHRTFHKPLGYAGDYEMVNMMLRSPFEGATLYAKILNSWFVKQWPAEAHRNRITYLVERLEEEGLRGARNRQPIRVLNLGCGPAHELVKFFAESDLCDHVELTLWDFNDETVARTQKSLDECKRRFGRSTPINVTKKSVHQVLKEGGRNNSTFKGQFDYIYCAGLFDYLTNRTCKQLVNTFYDWLTPQGLIAVTNVVDFRPFRHMLEHLLDWNLIYRSAADAQGLQPDRAMPEDCHALSDITGVNLFVESRKPNA